MTKISKHITLAEATKSQAAERLGVSNIPTPEHLESMKYIAVNVFEPIREHFKVPIAITSFYRSPKINQRIGGSISSQHCKGEAMDIDADILGGVTNSQIFDYIKDNLEFDQLIWEFGNDSEPAWVHVSLKKSNNRKQVLKCYKEGINTVYVKYDN